MRKLKRSRKMVKLRRQRAKRDLDDSDLFSAWMIIKEGGVEILDDYDIISDDVVNPEEAVIKNDTYNKLSDEAKEVISTILNSPVDFVNACISVKTGLIRRRKNDHTYFIKKFFRKKWGSRLKVRKVFSELNGYIKKIN